MDFSYLDDWMEEDAGTTELEGIGEGYRHIFVIVENEGGEAAPSTLEAMGQARHLADQIGVYVFAVPVGEGVEASGEALIAYGADRVLVFSDPALSATTYQPAMFVEVLADLVERYRPEILLLAATPLGSDLAPRLAQRLETGLISHCLRLEMDMAERLLLGTSAVLGGEVYHTVACPEARPQMATLVPGFFGAPYRDAHRSGVVEAVATDSNLAGMARNLDWIEMDVKVDLPPVPLSKAQIVVAAGRGMADEEGFALVERLAERLGGYVAGSRGAFDEGWIGEDRIVGVGGEFIHPDLYVACGVSGDIHHYFGLTDSKFIVSINPDRNAPINRIANMALLADARQVIPAMLAALEA
jgi:electron transfer flavoprotein alpha subunit